MTDDEFLDTYKESTAVDEVTEESDDYGGDKITPELEELTRQGKFQPTSREMLEANKMEDEEEPVTDNEGNNIDDMDSEEFISKYTEGMDEEEAQSVKDMAKGDSGYEDFLRGQVEARQKGQGGNY